MRKYYLLVLSFFISISSITAQTTCLDTIYYPHSKMTSYDGLAIMDVAGGVTGVSQTFESGNGLIHGIRAFVTIDNNGIPGDAAPIILKISVVNVDALNKPTTVIDSNFVAINDLGDVHQNLMFNAPVSVSGRYAVVVELNPATAAADTAYYMANNQTGGDGAGQGLMATNFFGVWYNFWLDFTSYDSDVLLAPIFEKSIEANFTSDFDTVCLGSNVIFTNTSTIDTSYMINRYESLGMGVYEWDYDDGSGIYNHEDTTYLYSVSGDYNSQLLITSYGYTGNCVDSVQKLITVQDTTIANFGFTDLGGGAFQFSDSSTTAFSYSWGFGDGSPVDTTQNPSHTYASMGVYYVCLTVSNNCNINTFCDSVDFTVGIDDFYAADYVNIFPIPADKHFFVTVPSNYYNGDIIISDVVGQQVKMVGIENQDKVKIETEDISEGVYFASIQYNGERVFTKRIVIKR